MLLIKDDYLKESLIGHKEQLEGGRILVVRTDFALQDGTIIAMYGVAYQAAPDLIINNLIHDIEPYNIHDTSCRLLQATNYWTADTVFFCLLTLGLAQYAEVSWQNLRTRNMSEHPIMGH